jgi:hypothetical protein
MLEQAPKLSKECLDYVKGTQYKVVSVKCDSKSFQVEFYDIENDLSVYLYRYEDGWYTLAKHSIWTNVVSSTVVQFDTLHDAVNHLSAHLVALRNSSVILQH